ncbi:MAG: histidine phosphatase family protein [Myxococcota bacterium]
MSPDSPARPLGAGFPLDRPRRLVVLRHAKAVSEVGSGSDHGRVLTDRGRRDARKVAEQLATIGWVPERVIASNAARTLETWERMLERITGPIPLVASPRLYGGGPEELRELVSAVPSEVHTVLVIGHNPGWEQVVAWLTGDLVPMGTANAALLLRQAPSWADALAPASFALRAVLRPTEVGD